MSERNAIADGVFAISESDVDTVTDALIDGDGSAFDAAKEAIPRLLAATFPLGRTFLEYLASPAFADRALHDYREELDSMDVTSRELLRNAVRALGDLLAQMDEM